MIVALPGLFSYLFSASELRVRFCSCKTGLNPSGFPTDRSKVVALLHFYFVCASVVSYVTFVLSLFVPRLSFFWCLGRAVHSECGISWVSSLMFLL